MKDKKLLAYFAISTVLITAALVGARVGVTNLLPWSTSGPIEVSTSTTDLGLLHDTGPGDLGAAISSLGSFGANVTPANGRGGFLGLSNLSGTGTTSLLSNLPSNPFRSSPPTTETETEPEPSPSPVSPAPVYLPNNGKGVKLTNGGTAVLGVNGIIDVVDGGVSSSSGNKEGARPGQEPSIRPSQINIKVNVHEAELLDSTITKLGGITSSIDTTSEEMGSLIKALKDTAKKSKEFADGQISAATTRIADHALQSNDDTKKYALKVFKEAKDTMTSSAEKSLKVTLGRVEKVLAKAIASRSDGSSRSRTTYAFLWDNQWPILVGYLGCYVGVIYHLMSLWEKKEEDKTNKEKKLERICKLAGAFIFFTFTGLVLAMVAHVVADIITNPMFILAANAIFGWYLFPYGPFLFDE